MNLKKILIKSNIINIKIIRIISNDKILLSWNFFISIRFENWLPIKEKIRKYGVKPKRDDIKNFVFEISKVDKNKFWINKGNPNINLNKIKYSRDDFFIILFNFLLNLLMLLWKYFSKIFLKKRKKQKLPKTIEIIFIKNPRIKPKKKLEASIIIKLPGREKVKNKKEKMKYNITDSSKLFLIIRSNWIKKLNIKSIILLF